MRIYFLTLILILVIHDVHGKKKKKKIKGQPKCSSKVYFDITADDQPILDFFDGLDGFNGHIQRDEKYEQLHCEPRMQWGAGGNVRNHCGPLIRGPYHNYQTQRLEWKVFLPDWKLNPENSCQIRENLPIVQQGVHIPRCATHPDVRAMHRFDQEFARKTFCETRGNRLIVGDQSSSGPAEWNGVNDKNICWCE